MLIRQGWAGRIGAVADERRQILDLLLPGDLCGIEAMMIGAAEHDICALTPLEVECFDAATVVALAAEHATLASALLRESLRQTARSRAGQSRMRKRRATERLADLIESLVERLDASDHEAEDDMAIPLTQFDLADATGLTAIHVNRSLRHLRLAGVVAIDRRRLRVLDLPKLHLAAGYLPRDRNLAR